MSDNIQQLLLTARKNQILDAATSLFKSKGFHPTTTRDIATQAGIAEGTIYNYFPSKTALLLGIFDRMKDAALTESVPPALDAPDFPTFVRLYLSHPLAALETDDFALFRIIISESLVNEDLRTQYDQQIFQPTLRLDEQYFRDQAAKFGFPLAQPQLAVRFIATLMLGLIMERILGGHTADEQPDDLLQYVATLMHCAREDSQP